MLILTDVDGVLLNWNDAFFKWMADKGHVRNEKREYDLSQCFDDLDSTKLFDLVETFNASAHMGFLHPLHDAVKYVKKLHEEYGVVFHAISSMGNDPFAIILREQNLIRIFGENVFEKITILGCGENKIKALTPYKDSRTIWLEDHIQNAQDGAALGLQSFLFNRPSNTKFISNNEIFTRVSGWAELLTFIEIYLKRNT